MGWSGPSKSAQTRSGLDPIGNIGWTKMTDDDCDNIGNDNDDDDDNDDEDDR